MTTLILDEKEYVDKILSEGALHPSRIYLFLGLYARYLYHEKELRKTKIIKALDAFMEENYPRYNPVDWGLNLEKYAGKASRYPLCQCRGIWLTKEELDTISGIHDKVLERLAFTLLCLAKFNNFRNPLNNNWVNSSNGEIYSIPFFVHTPIVFYRTDLFEDAGIKEFPKTWEEYADAAKKLTYGEVYGTIIEAKQAVEPVTHLVDWIYQAGGSIIDAEGNISIHSPENKQVFEYLLKMMYEDESVMPGSIGYDNADVHNLFMQGKVAMVKNWPYMYSMAKDPEQSTVSDSFAVAVQPAGKEQASSAWTWGFGISSSFKNKEAAWEFIKWATSSEKLAELGISSCNPVPRTSSLNAVQEDISLSDFDKESIQTMCDALNYASNATENPNFPTVQNELSYTLSNIMSRQVEIEEGLEQAEETIKEAIE